MGVIIPTTENVLVNDLKSDGKNPNKMSKAQHEALAENIRRFGFLIPIITNKDLVIADGEQRWTVAKKMGIEKVPVIRLPLREVDRRILRQVLNKLKGEHDFELDLEEYKLISSDDGIDDLKKLLAMQDAEFQRVSDYLRGAGQELSDEVPTNVNARVKKGDLWKLGEHRIYCGDSTEPETITILMGEEKADMVFTDPPYGVDYVGKTDEALTIQNDAKDAEGTKALFAAVYKNARMVLKDGGAIYATVPAGPLHILFASVMNDAGDLRQIMVWVKDQFVLGRSDYHYRHEPILYGWKCGGKHEFIGGRTQDTVWEFDRPKASREHPTMKPVELIKRAIQNSSKDDEIVLDLFGGSGSTLIAAEATKRRCFMAEIDPHYCDVIISRWEETTGKKAVKC